MRGNKMTFEKLIYIVSVAAPVTFFAINPDNIIVKVWIMGKMQNNETTMLTEKVKFCRIVVKIMTDLSYSFLTYVNYANKPISLFV